MPSDQTTAVMSLADAEIVGVLTRDLREVLCMRTPRDPPDSFMVDQDEDVRQAAWNASLDAAEAVIRAKLRAKGVDA